MMEVKFWRQGRRLKSGSFSARRYSALAPARDILQNQKGALATIAEKQITNDSSNQRWTLHSENLKLRITVSMRGLRLLAYHARLHSVRSFFDA